MNNLYGLFYGISLQAWSVFWRGGGRNLGPSTKRGPGVLAPEIFGKSYMQFGALYCSCSIKIINLENVKVLLFLLFEKNV